MVLHLFADASDVQMNWIQYLVDFWAVLVVLGLVYCFDGSWKFVWTKSYPHVNLRIKQNSRFDDLVWKAKVNLYITDK